MSTRVSRSNRIAQPSTPPVLMPSVKKLSLRKGVFVAPAGQRFLTETVAGITYYLTETVGGITYYLTETA